jgi:hypothetical protein
MGLFNKIAGFARRLAKRDPGGEASYRKFLGQHLEVRRPPISCEEAWEGFAPDVPLPSVLPYIVMAGAARALVKNESLQTARPSVLFFLGAAFWIACGLAVGGLVRRRRLKRINKAMDCLAEAAREGEPEAVAMTMRMAAGIMFDPDATLPVSVSQDRRAVSVGLLIPTVSQLNEVAKGLGFSPGTAGAEGTEGPAEADGPEGSREAKGTEGSGGAGAGAAGYLADRRRLAHGMLLRAADRAFELFPTVTTVLASGFDCGAVAALREETQRAWGPASAAGASRSVAGEACDAGRASGLETDEGMYAPPYAGLCILSGAFGRDAFVGSNPTRSDPERFAEGFPLRKSLGPEGELLPVEPFPLPPIPDGTGKP